MWQSFLLSTLSLAMMQFERTSALATQAKSVGGGLGCFICNSFNRSDVGCLDPFNPAHSTYQASCKQGIGGRVGVFPAHYCVKMSGRSVETGVELVVRTCTLENMHYQCGHFKFEDVKYEGCLTACERNGCNHGNPTKSSQSWTTVLVLCALCSSLLGIV